MYNHPGEDNKNEILPDSTNGIMDTPISQRIKLVLTSTIKPPIYTSSGAMVTILLSIKARKLLNTNLLERTNTSISAKGCSIENNNHSNDEKRGMTCLGISIITRKTTPITKHTRRSYCTGTIGTPPLPKSHPRRGKRHRNSHNECNYSYSLIWVIYGGVRS